jgi:hypothetical protein
MGPYSSRNALLRARHSLKCRSCHVLLATEYCTPTLSSECLQPSSQGHWLAVADQHSYFYYSRIALRESSTFGSMLDCLHLLSGSWTQVLKSLSSLRRVAGGGRGSPHALTNSEFACEVLLDELICKCFQLSGVLFITVFMCGVTTLVRVAHFDSRNVTALALLCTKFVVCSVLLSSFYKLQGFFNRPVLLLWFGRHVE